MRVLHRIVTFVWPLALAASAACAGDPPQAPHALRPIPEERARELIARTFREVGVTPERDRLVGVGRDAKQVRLEVAAAGRKFGIAYLTAADWEKAGEALPARGSNGSLVVANGQGGTRILCLFADDYTEDDLTGDVHTSTTIAADRRLERDVRDFLHRAEEQSWP
jgi:hypothetical protein